MIADSAQVITSVVETGGDGGAVAQWTGNSFTGTSGSWPGGTYTVPPFGPYARSYSDRGHAWTNASGTVLIPPYLMGNDYIMIRNDNRDNTGLRLAVTVSQDAIVYVLIDNRIGDSSANANNPPFNGSAISAWTGMQWINTNGFQPVMTGRNRTSNATLPDEVGIDEGTGTPQLPNGDINNWFSVYSNRYPAGTFTLWQQGLSGNNMYGVVVAVAPPVAPVISLVSPATNNATFYTAASNLVLKLTASSPMDTNNIKLTLNGVDVSSSLVVTGSTQNAGAIFSGLQPNTVYTGSITATNAAGLTTLNFVFDTFATGSVVVVEAEDYNYGDGDCQPIAPEDPLESQFGGFYHDPSAPGAYLNAIGAIGIDYNDTATNRGSTITNAYRLCDFVGTKVSTDNARPPFPGSGFSDYDVWQIQTGEWLNYTRAFAATNYNVYLRVTSGGATSFRLDAVDGDVSTTGQTTSSLGTFSVPNTAGAYQLVPLKNVLGNNAVISFSGAATTLRLTALSAANNVQANFIVLVPVAAAAPPFVSQSSPGANATGVYPDTAITATIANGDTAVNTASIVLRFNGVDVTAGTTITPNANGATLSYDPPGFLAPNTTNTVSIEFANDAVTPALFTNAWSFITTNIPTVPSTFATATGSASDSGFNIKVRKAPNTAPTASFPATILRAEQQLQDLIIDPNTNLPYPNEAGNGSTTASLLNFEQSGTNALVGVFNSTNGYLDTPFPLIPSPDPRWTNDPNDIAIEATAYLELSAGVHQFAVRSDDGFRMTVGPTFGDTNLVLAQVDAGRGDAETAFDFLVLSDGVYAFRLLYFEAQGGASLEFYSINRTNGARTLINDSLTAGYVPAYRSRVGVAPGAPPQIVNVTPANNSFFVDAAGGLSFEALSGEGNTIAPADVHLTLNGVDVSGDLAIGGTSSDRTATYNALQPNQTYVAVVTVYDSNLRAGTNVVQFDTFDANQVVTVEAEDYNYADSSCPTTFNAGGGFLDPVPVDGYLGFVGLAGIDYFDTATNAGANIYRPCDPVGVQITADATRPAYMGTNDYQVWRMAPGEWLNYTRLSWNGAYRVYIRAANPTARTLTLSKVTTDASAPNQTAALLGRFVLPKTASVTAYQYVPLVDALGNPATISVGAFETLRLGSLDANNDVAVNFIVLAPDNSGSPPWIASASPAPGATKVQPGESINIVVAHGDTAVNPSTVALSVDGVNVTSGATITPDIYFTSIDYTPPTLWSTGATHIVKLVFQDDAATTVSNQWSFTTASGLIGFPIKVNFGASGSPTPAGYLEDIGEVYGARTNGYIYGWDRNIVADGRIRNSSSSPDLRFDTFVHMIKATPAAVWEIVVPNGTYDVRIVGGDPTATDSVFQYDIEGTITPTYIPVSGAWWADFSASATVNDGKLTLRSGPASQTTANNNKVCFIDLVPPIAPVAPTVTRDPLPLTVDAGQQATFSVTYRATDPLTFQWYHDGAPVPGGTSATLVIPSAQGSDAGGYSVAITNIAGGTLSGSAQLTVNGGLISNVVLRATLSGTNVLISWTNTVNGGSLKQADDITPPVTWSPVTNAVFESNGNHNVLLPADAAKKFFKLRP
jgi:hypothetical protein